MVYEFLSICLRPRIARRFGRPWTRRFAHIRDWIFDLDNCLYPASTGLFELIDERMGAYIQRLLGCDAARSEARPESAFPRAWDDACRADEGP